jgi:hypothetical protein
MQTFRFFVFGLWNYCTMDRKSLVAFAFQAYDKVGRGALSRDDIYAMMRDLFGSTFESNPRAQSLMSYLLPLDYKGRPVKTATVTLAEFGSVAQRNEMILYIPFRLQTTLRTRVMGERWWMRKSEDRVRLTRDGKFDIRAVQEVLNRIRSKKKLSLVHGVLMQDAQVAPLDLGDAVDHHVIDDLDDE